MYEDDPRYVVPKKSLVGPTIGITLAIMGTLLMLARRCSEAERRDRAQLSAAELRRLREDLKDVQPNQLGLDDAHGLDDAPVEFELVHGADRTDLGATTVRYGDRALTLARTPTWVWTSPGLSLTYPSKLRAVASADGLILTSDDASAEIGVVDATGTVDEGLAEMAAMYESTGKVIASEPATVTLLGHEVTGRYIATQGPTIEMFVVAAGKRRQLRVIISAPVKRADLAPFHAALAELTLAKRPRTPEFTATLHDARGAELGTAGALVGEPFTVADDTLTIARRATVRARRNSIRFEHAPELAVLDTGAPVPSVMLRSTEITIQVMVPPMRMEPAELAAGTGVLTDVVPLTREFGGTSYRGVSGQMSLGAIQAITEIYALERGGRQFVVMIQAPATRADEAIRLAAPLFASLR